MPIFSVEFLAYRAVEIILLANNVIRLEPDSLKFFQFLKDAKNTGITDLCPFFSLKAINGLYWTLIEFKIATGIHLFVRR